VDKDVEDKPASVKSIETSHIGQRDATSGTETRTSIDALSARFEAKRQSSITDSRGPARVSPSAEVCRIFEEVALLLN
jgi:hypothetical protein